MGLFSKKSRQASSASTSGALQYPDELAQEAALKYGSSDFEGALEAYRTAIDKLHTMEVVAPAGSRIRTPGPQDQPILDGFVNSLGAAMSMDPEFRPTGTAEQAVIYLEEIANEAGAESERYRAAIKSIEFEMR